MDNLFFAAGLFCMTWAFIIILVLAMFFKRWWSITLCLLAAPASTALIIGACIYFHNDLLMLPLGLLAIIIAGLTGVVIDE